MRGQPVRQWKGTPLALECSASGRSGDWTRAFLPRVVAAHFRRGSGGQEAPAAIQCQQSFFMNVSTLGLWRRGPRTSRGWGAGRGTPPRTLSCRPPLHGSRFGGGQCPRRELSGLFVAQPEAPARACTKTSPSLLHTPVDLRSLLLATIRKMQAQIRRLRRPNTRKPLRRAGCTLPSERAKIRSPPSPQDERTKEAMG
ncbi:hypothetical protein VUR80DRAFT_959 [Thermomyces stellatus]